MHDSFNLCNKPWLPVAELRSGRIIKVSLNEFFKRLPEFREIVHDSPLVVSSVIRFLQAIIYRAIGYPTEKESARFWQDGKFPVITIREYLQAKEALFDLFDKERPFYQSLYESSDPAPPQRLIHELASGNNAVIFDHNFDSRAVKLPPDAATLYLIASQGWAVGGGKSGDGFPNFTHGPYLAGAMVIVQGKNLFHTLLQNLVGKSPLAGWPTKNDLPAWETNPKSLVNLPNTPSGYLDYLTWQTRTIRLHPEKINGDTFVTKVSYAQGRKYAPENVLFDPAISYRSDEKNGWLALKISETKACWRDSGALLNLPSINSNIKRPEVLQWLAQVSLEANISNSERLSLRVYGICNDKAKIFLWRRDAIPLPLKLLDDSDRVEFVQLGIQKAEEVAKVIKEALFRFVRVIKVRNKTEESELKGPDKEKVQNAIKTLQAENKYWAFLDVEFLNFVQTLGECDKAELETVLAKWVKDTLKPLAIRTFNRLTKSFDLNADCLKAHALGMSTLHRKLKKILPQEVEALANGN